MKTIKYLNNPIISICFMATLIILFLSSSIAIAFELIEKKPGTPSQTGQQTQKPTKTGPQAPSPQMQQQKRERMKIIPLPPKKIAPQSGTTIPKMKAGQKKDAKDIWVQPPDLSCECLLYYDSRRTIGVPKNGDQWVFSLRQAKEIQGNRLNTWAFLEIRILNSGTTRGANFSSQITIRKYDSDSYEYRIRKEVYLHPGEIIVYPYRLNAYSSFECTVRVDPLDQVPETNENNNRCEGRVRFSGG